ncbi:MAG: hypothetical protein QOH30_2237, partial [Baekduia sp.]|nr:hypothetical protein [Baekduia sp.]
MLAAPMTAGRTVRSHLPRRLLASVALSGALLGVSAAGAAAPPARGPAATARTGGLTVWVDSLPRGLEPRVRVRGPGTGRPITEAVTQLRLRPGVYTVVARPVDGGARRYFARRPRLSVRVRPGGTAVALVDYINVVPRTTRALSRGMARRLRATTPTTLVFQGAAPIGLGPGDVVVAGPGPRSRDGLLRRVVSVRQEGARTIVRTGAASLTDALPSGGLDLQARSRPGFVPPRVPGELSEHEKVIRLPGVNLPFDRTLLTGGFKSDRCTADGDLTLRGGLFVEPTVQISTSWGFFPPKLRKASFTGTLSERAELVLGAKLTGDCEADFTTPAVKVATFAVPVGPIAVPVTAELSAHLSLRTSGTVAASASVHQSASLTGGLSYGGGKLTTVQSAQTDFTVDPPQITSLEGNATLRAGPRLTLRIAGAAGASLGVDGVLDLDVTPRGDPVWSLFGGIALDAGLDLFNIRKDVDLFRYRLPFPIATAQGGGQGSTPPDLGLPPVRVRGLGDVFDRPDLSGPPVDTLQDGTALTIVCTTRGAPVAGFSGVSDVWHGLADGNYINDVSVVATSGLPAVPQCQVPAPSPTPAPTPGPKPGPTPGPTPRPVVTPPPVPTPPPDTDGDGVLDSADTCPAAAGVPPKGCPRQRGIALAPNGGGYWLAAEDGGVFSFGNAPFHGSHGGRPLGGPIVGIAATADGGGYWLVGADGGVLAFGNAGFHGSYAGKALNAPIVGMAATADGGGYWLVGADGGVLAFGNAGFHGSYAGMPLAAPIVGIAATADGGGYWLVGADGGV